MKILVLSSYAASLQNFRAELMLAMQGKGYEVITAAPESEDEWSSKLSKIGVRYVPVLINRTGLNPFEDVRSFIDLIKLMFREKPDVVFTYHAKTVIYGCLAAKIAGVKKIYALLAGLGSAFRMNGIKGFILNKVLSIEYKVALSCCQGVFFQNKDDRQVFVSKGLVDHDKTIIINGSGVNLKRFTPQPLPSDDVFLFIGRLLRDKGLIEYMEAARRVKEQYPTTRFLVVGPYDTNPSAVKREEVAPFIEEGSIEYLGATDDVRPYLAQCSVFVLPSYHEGTPRSVLEAMATARPIITTDAPGCRETVVNRKNGFLVPVKDVSALVDKMIWMINNRAEVERMGQESFKICKDKFDVNLVNECIIKAMGL